MAYQVPQHINKDKIFIINRSKIEGRLDPSIYKESFKFVSNIYPNVKLSDVAYINPKVSFYNMRNEDVISFIPMENIDEQMGEVAEYKSLRVSETKGYTKFINNDLLWAKITPCMQNGKSAIVRNLINGLGCGSTEFYVIRPKTDVVIVEYIHFLLHSKKILETAQNYFGGSAGQQRVPISFLEKFNTPLPPLSIQSLIVQKIEYAKTQKQAKEAEARELLDSIDDYLLNELRITVPNDENLSIKSRIFTINLNSIERNRLDCNYFDRKYRQMLSCIHEGIYSLATLGDITSFLSTGLTPKSSSYTEQETDFSIIKAGSYTGFEIDLSKVAYTVNKQSYSVKKGDIFVLAAAHQAEYIAKQISYLSDVPAPNTSFVGELLCVRANETVNSMYLYSLLSTKIYKTLLNREKRGQTSHLYSNDVKHICIPIPPIDKQNSIAQHIEKLRSQAKVLQEEGKTILENAKRGVERMIMGE